MTAIVWTTLITAVATISASLGAVWIKGHYDDRAQARQAEQNRSIAREDQQRQAYGELVKAARLVVRNFLELGVAYVADTPDIPAVNEAFSQAVSLAAEMNQATALVELVGSPGARKQARAMDAKARACAEYFQFRELFLAATTNTTVGKLIAGAIPLRFRKELPSDARELLPFDPDKAVALCGELEAAIDQFIEAMNTELAK